MRVDQYSMADSVRVKARANYQCELCGSDQMVQAHAPGGDHSDWRDGVCLCAQHHSEQHPDVPRSLFFLESHQPYWPNVTAKALGREFDCHSRTVIRAAKLLGISSGFFLSAEDKERLRMRILKLPKAYEPWPRRYSRRNGAGYHVYLELSNSQVDNLRETARDQEKPIWALATGLVVRELENAKI